jgi:acetyl-CoA carboxylase biotin carboxylase subunit
MGEAAVRLALEAGYSNAGTVEFLVDAEKNFYFLEVNTRLQVEHPVTELVTGLDLVHLQIQVAQGAPLPLTQADIRMHGHAIECRVYAEDPENNFFPSPGRITRLVQPSGPGIREDCGIYEGWVVPLDYDPMLSKVGAYAPTRQAAIARMLRALDEYFVGGIKTNLHLLAQLFRDPGFVHAEMDTGYLDRWLAEKMESAAPASIPASTVSFAASTEDKQPVAIAAAAIFHALGNHGSLNGGSGNGGSNGGFGNGGFGNGRNGQAPAAISRWKQRARSEGLS